MLPTHHYLALSSHPAIGPTAIMARSGDLLAQAAVIDWLEDEGGDALVEQPFKVGQCYLICTVTLYYCGRVTSANLAWLTLEDASWVHWTGRLSTLLARQSFTHRDLASRKPRVEPCGKDGIVTLSLGAVVSAYPWHGDLPKEPLQ